MLLNTVRQRLFWSREYQVMRRVLNRSYCKLCSSGLDDDINNKRYDLSCCQESFVARA